MTELTSADLDAMRECPLCGGVATLTYDPDEQEGVCCLSCRLSLFGYVSTDAAITAWNRRARDHSQRDKGAVDQPYSAFTTTGPRIVDPNKRVKQELHIGDIVRVAWGWPGVDCMRGHSCDTCICTIEGFDGDFVLSVEANGEKHRSHWNSVERIPYERLIALARRGLSK